MPTPTRLNTTLTFQPNGIRLSPPPENAQPAISASHAWRLARITQTSASYELVLAQWHSTVPLIDGKEQLFDVLVWVVMGTNVRVAGRRGILLGRCNQRCGLWMPGQVTPSAN
jgi:hypothetical protein